MKQTNEAAALLSDRWSKLTKQTLATFSVIFLVLLIHLLVLFVVYVGLAVLLVLLERQNEKSLSVAALRKNGEATRRRVAVGRSQGDGGYLAIGGGVFAVLLLLHQLLLLQVLTGKEKNKRQVKLPALLPNGLVSAAPVHCGSCLPI